MASPLRSITPVLFMAKEGRPELRRYALTNLNFLFFGFWPEVAASVNVMYASLSLSLSLSRVLISLGVYYSKSIYEDHEDDEESEVREMAALLLSKVSYCTGNLDDALIYAAQAGVLFDHSDDPLYVNAIIRKAFDDYIILMSRPPINVDPFLQEEEVRVSPELEHMVESFLKKCGREALGLVLDCKRLDLAEDIITKSDDIEGAIACCMNMRRFYENEYRREVLFLVVDVSQRCQDVDYYNICQTHMLLDDPGSVASILIHLLGSDDIEDMLKAFQIAFDLYDNDNHQFLHKVVNLINESPPELLSLGQCQIVGILSGEKPISLSLKFLHCNNRADLRVLDTMMPFVGQTNSVYYTATVYANAIMHAGTGITTFMEKNQNWFARAKGWAEFSITAGLGVIYRGQLQHGRSLMAPFLPQCGIHARPIPFAEGGALFALGLMHGTHKEDITPLLLEYLRDADVQAIQYGACLGLGLSGLGTADEDIYGEIEKVLYTGGEAVGVSMGLLLVGTTSEKAEEMLAYAHKSEQEKTIRGLALGIALTVYGQEDRADALIKKMIGDPDHILRCGGMYALALAYRGTSSYKAISQLLHFSASDVSDDVRRTAVLALGFVLYSEPDKMPQIVSLLSDSYNPHVRYDAAFALGISCGGTGLSEAISLLQPLISDSVDFVRQGALVAMAMVMIQISDPRVGAFRKQLERHYNLHATDPNIVGIKVLMMTMMMIGSNWNK